MSGEYGWVQLVHNAHPSAPLVARRPSSFKAATAADRRDSPRTTAPIRPAHYIYHVIRLVQPTAPRAQPARLMSLSPQRGQSAAARPVAGFSTTQDD